jgi:hypothetical protein
MPTRRGSEALSVFVEGMGVLRRFVGWVERSETHRELRMAARFFM